MKRPGGNGPTQATIDTIEQPERGWVMFCAGRTHPPPAEAVPLLISHSLRRWQEEHPERRVRSSLGIVQDGHTAAVHLWYDTAQ